MSIMCGLDLLATFNRLQIETVPVFCLSSRARRLILDGLRSILCLVFYVIQGVADQLC